ncbi:MAG: nitrite/sulfite reductase [Vicinamibacterales bacterium]
MAGIDQGTAGRNRLSFADQAALDEFVDKLQKYESGELGPEDWRRFRLLRGTYGQRQDGVQMMRIKVPQGILTGAQMRVLADAATKYSRGFAHITTRQNIQMHFVLLKDAETVIRMVQDAGLTTREACGNSVRNITCCPYAGVVEDEVFDVTPYAEMMTRYFLGHPLSGNLPRKFKITFEGCPVDHALTSIHDIGLRAKIVNGRRGFQVNIAGSTSIMPVSGYLLYDFLPFEELFEVAEAIVRVWHRNGDFIHKSRNRMKFMIKALGWDAWKQKYDEALAEVRAEGGIRPAFDPAVQPVEGAPDWPKAPAPSVQTVAVQAATPVTGPGIMPGSVKLQPLSDAYVRWMTSNVGRQKQQGYAHVTARLPLGDFTAGQMRVLADLAEAYSDGTMRVTIEQNVLFRWVKVEDVEAIYQRLDAAGMGQPDANTLADVVSCPGAESCRLAVTQSRGLGRELTEYLSARPDLVDLVPRGDIKISGCPNGCGQHHVASIGFQGSVRKLAGKAVPQYFVMVGGGGTWEGAKFGKVVAKIPVHRITTALDRLVGLYGDNRTSPEEPLGDFFRRVPLAMATEALKDLAELLPNQTTDEDFIDLGEHTTFNPEVMDGECAS